MENSRDFIFHGEVHSEFMGKTSAIDKSGYAPK
jgi:hypothetical protein